MRAVTCHVALIVCMSVLRGGMSVEAQTAAESLHRCQCTMSRETQHFLSQTMDALSTCLQTLSWEVIRDNNPDAAANAAPVCVNALRPLSDSRGVGEGLEERLTASIKAQCDPAMPAVTHTLADLLGDGVAVAESLKALNLNAYCTNFGGDGVIDSLEEWITCVAASGARAAQTATAAIYPRALEWLDLVRPAVESLSPPEDDPNQIADALAALDSVRTELTAQSTVRFVDNGDGTITDFQTGLMWEKKDDAGDLHDMDLVLRWQDELPEKSIHEWLSALNGQTDDPDAQLGFAGHTDWRIPTITELQTIVDLNLAFPTVDPIFNTGCTPNCTLISCSCTAAFVYWSSTTVVSNPLLAWIVLFFDGSTSIKTKDDFAHVRAVRDIR